MGDEEFPPLLDAGFHKMTVEQLKTCAVDCFPHSKRRPELWKTFLFIHKWLKEQNVPCSIWVDGSFLTHKDEPGDVDLVFEIPMVFFESCNEEQRTLIEKLVDRFYYKSDKLDSHVFFNCTPAHPECLANEHARAQWGRDFGKAFYSDDPKGIAVVEVQP